MPRDLDSPTAGAVLGLLLAAGAGRRMGSPKALVYQGGESFLLRAVDALRDGGCDAVTVVLGAAADRAMEVLDHAGRRTAGVSVVHAEDWGEGMGASLRAGLHAAQRANAHDCALVSLVDLPDVDASVVRRLLEQLPRSPGVLGRAAYDGRPGHPVLIGRGHWSGVVASAEGDRGARDYLRENTTVLVDCGDLATGRDVDTPAQLGETPRR